MKHRLYLPISAFLILLYYYLISPASGFLGGAVFVLGGRLIPSIILILISIFIVQNLPWFKKWQWTGFIIVSFLLGTNTFLINLFLSGNPVSTTIEIIKPITRTNKAVIYLSKTGLDIKRNPFDFIYLTGNEAVGKLYFQTPRSLITEDSFINFISNNPMYLTSDKNNKSVTHFIETKGISEGWRVLLIMTIQDQFDGKVVIKSYYPWWLGFKPGHFELYDSKTFTANVINLLLHDNFWEFILEASLRDDKAPLLPMAQLDKSQINKAFV